ncbi:MAG TPA: choice-of-anchor tandem repeat GloVer-containing protein, partial [Nitrospira sp.]|nr:choice-of-anchor tandem repeat GloVer-containing protein [Nitrospira sp.]
DHLYGTLYSLNRDGTDFQVLRHFDPAVDGAYPQSELIEGADGLIYGTAWAGGPDGYGTVFSFNPDGNVFTVIHSFDPVNEGRSPVGALAQALDGRLYGVTNTGGAGMTGGIVYSLNTDGTDYQVVHVFVQDTDGAYPQGGLTLSSDGSLLFGTTSFGGNYNDGTIFELTQGGGGAVVASARSTSDGSAGGASGAATPQPFTALQVVCSADTLGAGGRLAGRIEGLEEQLGDLVLACTAPQGGANGHGAIVKANAKLPLPVITSSLAEQGTVGVYFYYQAAATGYPTFSAMDLPAALSIDSATGVLDGIPQTAGTFNIPLSATNSTGTTTETLVLTVADAPPQPPVITSPLTATGTYKQNFYYKITAEPKADLFLASLPPEFAPKTLPDTLNFDDLTGEIHGEVTETGIFDVIIVARNAAGEDSKVLELTLAQAQAEVTLSNLQQEYDGSPKAVTVTTNPDGLAHEETYNGSSTHPTDAGSYAVTSTVVDKNYQGDANGTLTITQAPATVTVTHTTQIYDGSGQLPAVEISP